MLSHPAFLFMYIINMKSHDFPLVIWNILHLQAPTILIVLKKNYYVHIYSTFHWNSLTTYTKWTLAHAIKRIFVILRTNLWYTFYILTLTSFQVWLQLVCHRKRPLVLSRCQGSFLLLRSYSLFSQSDHPASSVEVLKNYKYFTNPLWNESKENNWYRMLTRANFNFQVLQLVTFIRHHVFLHFLAKMRTRGENQASQSCHIKH